MKIIHKINKHELFWPLKSGTRSTALVQLLRTGQQLYT